MLISFAPSQGQKTVSRTIIAWGLAVLSKLIISFLALSDCHCSCFKSAMELPEFSC